MAKRVERKNNNRPTNNAKKQKNLKPKGTCMFYGKTMLTWNSILRRPVMKINNSFSQVHHQPRFQNHMCQVQTATRDYFKQGTFLPRTHTSSYISSHFSKQETLKIHSKPQKYSSMEMLGFYQDPKINPFTGPRSSILEE